MKLSKLSLAFFTSILLLLITSQTVTATCIECDWEEQYPEEEYPEEQEPKDEVIVSKEKDAELKYQLDFISTFSYKKIERIKNLSQAGNKLLGNDGVLNIGDFDGGFWAQRELRWQAGLGPALEFFYDNASGFQGLVKFKIGLAPVKGKSVIFTNTYDSREEMEAHSPSIPSTSFQALDMKKGDSAYFESQGGMLFKAKIGITYVDFGRSVLTLGSVKNTVTRLEENSVIIRQVHAKIKDAALYISNIAASISKEKVKEHGEGLAFMVDLSDEAAAHAYDDMIKGNVVPMQEMANDQDNEAVVQVDSMKYSTNAKFKKFAYGIPFFRKSKAWGNSFTFTDVKNHEKNETTISNYGVYTKKKETVIGKAQRYYNYSFTGGLAHTTREDKSIYKDSHANFAWFFEDNNNKSKDFSKILKKFQYKTGLDNWANTILDRKVKNLGYLSLEFRMVLNDEFINALLARSSSEKSYASIEEESYRALDEYLNSDSKVKYCKKNDEKCRKKLAEKIKNSMKLFRESLKVMAFNKSTDEKKFSQEFINFGKAVWGNPFLFKTIFNKAKDCGAQIDFDLAGEKIERLKQSLKSNFNAQECVL